MNYYTHYCGPRKGGLFVDYDHHNFPTQPISVREQEAKKTKKITTTKKERQILDGWKDDPRMVFLANPGRDLTAKERKEWERNIVNYQIYSYPSE